jgi:hypothetical protein
MIFEFHLPAPGPLGWTTFSESAVPDTGRQIMVEESLSSAQNILSAKPLFEITGSR